MNLSKFVKPKSFKLYLVIGLLLYIIPYLYGLTSFVSLYLEKKTVFPDYVEEVKKAYINDNKDIAICVQGDTSGEFDIEYWAYIPYIRYAYIEENFNNRNTSFSGISHDLINISSCDQKPWVDTFFEEYNVSIYYTLNLGDLTQTGSNELFNLNKFPITENSLFVLLEDQYSKKSSKIALIRTVDKKNIGTLFRMANMHYPEQLNPLWKLLYIPALILDVLLWPLYLLLFLYSTFIAPPPR